MQQWVLLDTAIQAGRFRYALQLAQDWGSPLPLRESARLLHLAANAEDGDGEWFERAGVRWLIRFLTETQNVSVDIARTAADAMDDLDHDDGAPERLPGLLAR